MLVTGLVPFMVPLLLKLSPKLVNLAAMHDFLLLLILI
uniref:Uncharacterized protein n=1 Tax=Rhizophora mucronata TaxID=61149 RepID=A0A2P2P7X4_RHIMU